ncbi:MAG: DUF4340 domain-containing protein [Phycisphaerales bacterium]
MNDLTKTAVAIVLAAGLAGAAYVSAPRAVTDATFSDQGEIFFPEFTDPTTAKSLEVISYDEATATLTPFKVQFDGTRWVIPSHHNYPADAQANMAGAASAFIGLRKDTVVTDKASEHQALGVLAPDDDKAPLSGRGTRITIRGASDQALGDLIIGKAVKSDQVGGQVYARVPGKSRVYAVAFTRAVTSRFADWVQTDVLKLASAEVAGMRVDRYQIDEQKGTKTTTETVTISKAPETKPDGPQDPNQPAPPQPRWAFNAEPGGGPAEGQAVNEAPIDDAVNTLRTMRILGVRAKPEKLTAYFGAEPGKSNIKLDTLDLIGMGAKGFFLTRDGQFVANEGEVDIKCNDGVIYKLYFGELLVATGDELSAGTSDVIAGATKPEDAAKSAEGRSAGDEKESEKKDETKKGTEARYVLATVSFDESLLGPAPVVPTAPTDLVEPTAPEGYDPAKKPADGETESAEVTAYKAAKAKYEAEKAQFEVSKATQAAAFTQHKDRVAQGQKRAESLRKSLAPWYFVIDAASFAKLRPTRDSLVKAADAPASPQ